MMRGFWVASLIYLSAIAAMIFGAFHGLPAAYMPGYANQGDAASQQQQHLSYVDNFLVNFGKAWHFFEKNHAFEFFIAVGTVALAIFTARLWGATIKLGQDSERSIAASEKAANAAFAQVQLTHEQFIATHRPRFTVRFIKLDIKSSAEPLKVVFTIMNSGMTGADIEETRVDLVIADNPPYPDNKAGTDVTGGLALEPSDPVVKDFPKEGLTKAGLVVQQLAAEQKGERCDLYFVGVIIYRDRNKTRHQKAFCRIYDPGTGRFEPLAIRDDEYEYED